MLEVAKMERNQIRITKLFWDDWNVAHKERAFYRERGELSNGR